MILRRRLLVAAALVLLTLTPSVPGPHSPRLGRKPRPQKHARSGCCARRSVARVDRHARAHRTRAWVQHAARAGARPRRRVLHEQPRATRRRSSATTRWLRSAGHRADAAHAAGLARARVGQRQLRLERRGHAERPDAHRPPPSRVADGAARPRAGAVARFRKRARRTSASCRGGRGHRRPWLRLRPALSRRVSQQSLEGLYTSPIVPAAADHINAVVRDLVTRYAVDGIHLDYARYPSERFDYSRAAIREFRDAIRPTLTGAVQPARLDGQRGR